MQPVACTVTFCHIVCFAVHAKFLAEAIYVATELSADGFHILEALLLESTMSSWAMKC